MVKPLVSLTVSLFLLLFISACGGDKDTLPSMQQRLPNGDIIWDDHGTRCGTCMEIAVKTAQYKRQGKTLKEIRALIDAQYQSGYAAPTKTQLPM